MPPTLEELTTRRVYDPYRSYGNVVYIEIDGACRNNGYPTANAACGIVYSFLEPRNKAFLVPNDHATSQRAELYAAIVALHTALEFGDAIRLLGAQDIILQTDSAYLVNSMTNYINKWRFNDFISARNRPVVNEDLFRPIESLVFELKAAYDIQVRFKKVPREQNQTADWLANAVLDQACDSWMSLPVLNPETLDFQH